MKAQASKRKPGVDPDGAQVQPYGTLVRRPIALESSLPVVEALNQILADTITLRDLYKKHHWQASGGTFYQLHLLFDKHHNQLEEIVDSIAERIRILGGVSVAMGADVVELTHIPRPPRGTQDTIAQLSRLIEAHEILIRGVREGARLAAKYHDDGSNDLLVGNALRTNEMQVWFYPST